MNRAVFEALALDQLIVLSKIATLFAVMVVGWGARRYGYLSGDATNRLGRFVVDLALPALIVVQMIETVDRQSLRQDWITLALAAALFLAALGVGALAGRLMAPPRSRATFAYLVGTPNWIYLPLPIAQALYGADGVRAVLWCNIASQLLGWSLGVAVLRGRLFDREIWRKALLNPGLAAAVAGIAIAVAFPAARLLRGLDLSSSPALGPALGKVALDAAALTGSMTIPLSLVLIGAQLGGMALDAGGVGRELALVAAVRLLAAPLVTIVLFHLAAEAGLALPVVPRRVATLIAAMPAAVTCGIVVERYGGDTRLAPRAVVLTTMASVATVPVCLWVAGALGW